VSSLVLEEIKKIQKTTDKHRVGSGKGAGPMFRYSSLYYTSIAHTLFLS
jgi:hypothetical protein